MIEVLRSGLLTTIQDLGRPGYAHLGVPRSGAADTRSFRLANRLVGNAESTPCLEFTLGGSSLRFHEAGRIALTGAPAPIRLGGRPVPTDRWLTARSGDVLEIGVPEYGLRTYLAVAGGFDVPKTLGSCSTDTLSGLGPAPLQAGQRLAVGCSPLPPPLVPDCVASPVPGDVVVLRYRRGPRDDLFTEEMLNRFGSARWEVTAESNRVGTRLSGPAITTFSTDQLPSEGMMLGSIEMPPSGQPIIFLADHPTTGGYPVIGVVEADDVAVLAQTRPGTPVRFQRVSARASSLTTT